MGAFNFNKNLIIYPINKLKVILFQKKNNHILHSYSLSELKRADFDVQYFIKLFNSIKAIGEQNFMKS